MGTKRKASQASLPVAQQEQQIRRSRRIVSNDKYDEEPTNVKAVVNGDQRTDRKSANKPVIEPKTVESTVQPEVAPKRGRGRPPKQSLPNAKQVAKAIIHEKIDFNKDVVPIRTYGKSDPGKTDEQPVATALSKRVAATKATMKPNAVANSAVKISPASRTIKKKIEPSGLRRGNLTIQSPAKVEVQTSTTQVQPTISTIEGGGQKKVGFNWLFCCF